MNANNESMALGRESQGGVRVFVFFAIWTLWLSLEYWVFGRSSYLPVHDGADHFIPLITWLTQSWTNLAHARIIPVLCGLDYYGTASWVNWMSYPFLVLPPILANLLVFFVQRFFAGYFTCRVLKDILKISFPVAIVGGCAYTLMSFELGEMRLVHWFDEPGLPFVLWLVFRLPCRRLITVLPAAFLSGLVLGRLVGGITGVPFLASSACLVAWITRKDLESLNDHVRFLLMVVFFMAGCFATNLLQYYALIVNSATSQRADWSLSVSTTAYWSLFLKSRASTLLSSWIAVVLAVPWLLRGTRWNRADFGGLTLLFIGLLLGGILGTASAFIPESLGALHGAHFTRFDKVFPLAMVACAALGIQALDGMGQRRMWVDRLKWGIPVSWIICIFLGGMVLQQSWLLKRHHWDEMRMSGRTWRVLFDNPDIRVLAADIGGRPVRCATAGASHLIHPMYLLNYGLEIADGYVQLYPGRYQQFWAQVIEPVCAVDDALRVFFRWGCRVYLFHSSRDEDACLSVLPFNQWYNLNLLSLANVKYLVSRNPVRDERLVLRTPVISDDTRNAWVRLTWGEKLLRTMRGEQPPGPKLYIYENKQAFDRFFLVGKAKMFNTLDELYRALSKAPVEELATTAFLFSEDVQANLPKSLRAGSSDVSILSYEPYRIDMRVRAGANMLLVGSQLYYTWWKCRIDGVETGVIPCDGPFLAVPVLAGEHRVVLSYEPPYPDVAGMFSWRNAKTDS